jgi:GNAT superfamily N-acetyltransferase
LPVDIDKLCIEPLNDLHVRGVFCCKDRGIQNFCRGRLADHNRRHMMKAYVACERGGDQVLGFYYLLNTAVEPEKLGPAGGAPLFQDIDKIPAVYLGMIGVHEPLMRQGIGTQLMLHAFQQVRTLSQISGVWALTLDAIDDEAVSYYERFDFRRFGPNGREMYIPLGTILSALEEI